MSDDLDQQSPTDHYYGHDHLFSPVILLASNGNILERYEYDAYGTCHFLESDFTEQSPQTSSESNPYLFTGRRLDILDEGSLKIYYYRARTYHPEIGRFLQTDPAGLLLGAGQDNPFRPVSQYPDGINLYEYVRSNPVTGFDPTGLMRRATG